MEKGKLVIDITDGEDQGKVTYHKWGKDIMLPLEVVHSMAVATSMTPMLRVSDLLDAMLSIDLTTSGIIERALNPNMEEPPNEQSNRIILEEAEKQD